jgi:mRNA-degrading endonuclease toxin of MazEF toxin-antitoxin module
MPSSSVASPDNVVLLRRSHLVRRLGRAAETAMPATREALAIATGCWT